MIQDTIAKIESKVKDSSSIKEDHRDELLNLLKSLRTEIDSLAKTDSESAQTVAGFAELSTQMATRQQKKPELLELSLEGFSQSVDELEETHPRLVEVVNRLCTTLANMGI